jgi:hypothetical protein
MIIDIVKYMVYTKAVQLNSKKQEFIENILTLTGVVRKGHIY